MTLMSGTGVHHDVISGLGTIGGWFIHPPSGMRFGLCCNHVLAALGHASVGAPVWSQGASAGTLHAWMALQLAYYNTADAALFAVPATASLTWPHAVPAGTGRAEPGLRVYKHGATTGRTTGFIRETGLDRRFRLRGVGLWFQGILSIESEVLGPFSDHGDSGALVMNAETHEAVGLLLAKDEHLAYAFPITAAEPLLRGLCYAA